MPFDPANFVETKPEVDADGEVLLRAADYLERHGWLQGCWGYADGPRCVLGAIASVTSIGDGLYSKAKARLGDDGLGLIAWNNTPGRTKAEVIARLRDAAYGRL